MRALVVDHDGISGPGMLGERAAEQGVDLHTVVPHRGEAFPPAADYDFVYVGGAPWSLWDAEIAHWVRPELGLLRDAVSSGVPVLAVCFGAQALAAVLGAEVGKAPRKHIGWATVDSEAPDVVPPGPWLHWHGDAFTLPPGARLLASDETGPQAYAHGRDLAVQFHPEATREVIEPWVELSGDEFARLGVDGDALLAETERRAAEARPRARRLLDLFLAGVRDQEPVG